MKTMFDLGSLLAAMIVILQQNNYVLGQIKELSHLNCPMVLKSQADSRKIHVRKKLKVDMTLHIFKRLSSPNSNTSYDALTHPIFFSSFFPKKSIDKSSSIISSIIIGKLALRIINQLMVDVYINLVWWRRSQKLKILPNLCYSYPHPLI